MATIRIYGVAVIHLALQWLRSLRTLGVIRVPATRVRCLTQAAGLASPPDAIPNGLQFCFAGAGAGAAVALWLRGLGLALFAFLLLPHLFSFFFTSRQVTVPPRTIPLPCSISSPFHLNSILHLILLGTSIASPSLCVVSALGPRSSRPGLESPDFPPCMPHHPSNFILRQSNKLVIIITGTRISYLPHDSAPL